MSLKPIREQRLRKLPFFVIPYFVLYMIQVYIIDQFHLLHCYPLLVPLPAQNIATFCSFRALAN